MEWLNFLLEHIITIGGILLIFGAVLMFIGKVYYSSLMYVLADLCWSINSFMYGNTVGTVMVNIGLILGIGSMYKMHIGLFTKDLKI